MKTDDIKEDLKIVTRLSSTMKREIGVCVCDDGKGSMVFGNESSGTIMCGQCEPKLYFHTHPCGTANPSVGDIEGLMKVEGDIKDAEYCVGAMNGDKPEINYFQLTKRNNTISLSTVTPIV